MSWIIIDKFYSDHFSFAAKLDYLLQFTNLYIVYKMSGFSFGHIWLQAFDGGLNRTAYIFSGFVSSILLSSGDINICRKILF